MRKPALIVLFLGLVSIGFLSARLLDHRGVPPVTPAVMPDKPTQTAGKTLTPLSAVRAVRAVHGLIKVDDPSLVVDLRYATTHNFTGQRLYSHACLVLNAHTAPKLLAAAAEFQTLGYRLKIWDAYRPLSVQRVLWQNNPNGGQVASPHTGSDHNRGAAVDVTLVDARGAEVLMPSGFDDFTPRAASDYQQAPPEAIRHRELLKRIMLKHGFHGIKLEWWHFADSNAKAYPVLDIPFSAF
jgi:D-alanyl-D-alanine dipeptidase